MGTVDEFHRDTVLVMGTVLAGRAWRVWPDGLLTGVTYTQPWTVRGNTAMCPYGGREHPAGVPEDWPIGGGSFCAHAGQKKAAKHRPGDAGCSCGWWSYVDLSLTSEWLYATSSRGVTGLIKAHGLCTRGTKGYRSERADILALVEPPWASHPKWTTTHSRSDWPAPPDLWEAVLDRYPVPAFPTLAAASAVVRSI